MLNNILIIIFATLTLILGIYLAGLVIEYTVLMTQILTCG